MVSEEPSEPNTWKGRGGSRGTAILWRNKYLPCPQPFEVSEMAWGQGWNANTFSTPTPLLEPQGNLAPLILVCGGPRTTPPPQPSPSRLSRRFLSSHSSSSNSRETVVKKETALHRPSAPGQ